MLTRGRLYFAGERRIRVHTLALPITNKLADLYATADVQAISTLLTKMGKLPIIICRSLRDQQHFTISHQERISLP